ncbi:hypothetical protein CR152_31430 [Massilia violaceinigra]|uniref:Uncharacterized protein n=1 Tax=Massilia violaceinigra TaxID=2045208 RepID=A0A2D2DU64_9BURK|nr:hypothetical protein CR152_31430 [Massilia violaceinigra]
MVRGLEAALRASLQLCDAMPARARRCWPLYATCNDGDSPPILPSSFIAHLLTPLIPPGQRRLSQVHLHIAATQDVQRNVFTECDVHMQCLADFLGCLGS